MASGPMSFLGLFNTASDVVSMAGRRRGANMAVLDVSQPDIYEFVTAKAGARSDLAHFNLSVGVTDAFLRPSSATAPSGWSTCARTRPSRACRPPSCSGWSANLRMQAGTPDCCSSTRSTARTRCRTVGGSRRPTRGEVPLLPYESCNLGSITLARMCGSKHF
jgi:ribonucleoside-diphosphate reductase alpha chain